MGIINLTQHAASAEQLADGVVDFKDELHAELCALLTFEKIPDHPEIRERVDNLVAMVSFANFYHNSGDTVMIGGAPYLMGPLQNELLRQGYAVVYSFSKRVSEETILPDGSTKKTNVFKHIGWVHA